MIYPLKTHISISQSRESEEKEVLWNDLETHLKNIVLTRIRFWLISRTPSVGSKTYAGIFKHFYDRASYGKQDPVQVTFDL